MSLINGTDFSLKINDVALGQSKSADIRLSTDLPDATNKDSLGWREVMPGLKDSVVFADAISGDATLSFAELVAYQINKTKVTFEFEHNTFSYSGSAFIRSVEEVATYEQLRAFDLELQVTGILTFTEGTEQPIEFVEGGDIDFVEGGVISFVELV